jgi:DNA replication protein DnaC
MSQQSTPFAEIIPTHRPCDDCGVPVEWEPIMFDGFDIASGLPCLCDRCALERTRVTERKQRDARITDCQAKLAACIGERLRQTDIDHPEFNRAAWNVIKAAVNILNNRNIVLVGPSGLCKSRMMYLLCKQATWKSLSIAWVTTDELSVLADQLSHFATRNDARAKINSLQYAGRLVIDDIGKTQWTKQTEEVVWIILSSRYDHNRPTWASCNTHPTQLQLEGFFTRDRGAAIVGRILEEAQVFELKHH